MSWRANAQGVLRRTLARFGLIEAPALAGQYVPHHPTPEELSPGQVLVVRDGGLQKWACFRCPGGCGEKIMLSLSRNRQPHWKAQVDWLGRPSLEPSIRQVNKCRCHFWVRRGRVDWCTDSGRRARATGSTR